MKIPVNKKRFCHDNNMESNIFDILLTLFYCVFSVARVKITKLPDMNDDEPFYEASIKRLFKKPTTKILRHGQKIKAVERVLTCDCKPLEVNKKYLVFGREWKHNKTLYFDDYSIGYETSTPEQKKLLTEFRKIYRNIWCPRSFRFMFGENVWQNKSNSHTRWL